MPFKIAIVSRDPEVRMAAARAFDAAPAEWSVELADEEPEGADVVVHGIDVRAGGDLVFDPACPDAAVRAAATALARPVAQRTVAVVGATGGAGATAVALHLASEWGRGTCCAEAGGRGAGAWLGLPPDARTWSPDEDVSAAALPVAGGFRLLLSPAPSPVAAPFPVAAVRGAFSRVVLDVGAARDLEPLVSESVTAVLVMPPARPAAMAARALIDSFPQVRWVVVVNRLGPGGQIMTGGLGELVGRRVALELPCCPALRDAEDEARLLTGTWHRWRRGIARLARALDAC